MAQEKKTQKKTLTDAELENLKEVPLALTLKGIAEGYTRIFYDAPVNFAASLARKAENVINKHAMTGYAAVVTLPLGIVARNGLRSFHESLPKTEKKEGGKYSGWGTFGGIVGAGAGWYLAGTALFAQGMAMAGTAALAGKIGVGIGAAVVSGLLVTVPAFAVGVLAAGAVAAVATKAVSLALAAPQNIGTGWRRTKARFQGAKLDIEQLQPELGADSLQTRHDTERFRKASHAVEYLPEDGKRKIYESLKQKFDTAKTEKAANENGQTATATATAAAKQDRKL
ncbi:MAG: hypothetical protein EA357_05000 [Micavibrio sp.]|nr:MAG: hypothetical protein EA357_05000 [Micavibrio sp.]